MVEGIELVVFDVVTVVEVFQVAVSVVGGWEGLFGTCWSMLPLLGQPFAERKGE